MNNTTDSFQKILNREYWIAGGTKKFAHEFDDESLVDTIRFIHRKVKKHRLHEALLLCNMVYRIGYDGDNISGYYGAYKKQVDFFLDTSISDEEWLRQNSKIYVLLTEESKFRGLKTESTGNTVTKKIFGQDFKYSFNWA